MACKQMQAWAVMLAALFLVGCGVPAGPGPVGAGPGPVGAGPAPSPGGAAPPGAAAPLLPDQATTARLTAAANAMGFDVLAGLSAMDGAANVITSPLSLATVLAMLLHGADGETAAAIAGVLHLENPGDPAVRDGFALLTRALAGAGGGVELAAANSLWPQQGYPVRPEYLDVMGETFDAAVHEVDLGSKEAAAAIDRWVTDQTRGRITEMAKALGVPSPNLVLVLLNAVYFKGAWSDPFDAARTRPGTFTRADGSAVTVPFMSRRGHYPFAAGDGFQVLRLPYGDDGRFGMEIFLPDAGSSIGDLQQRLDASAWSAATAQFQEQDLLVSLPRFELAYHAADLDAVLQDLGMGIAYTPESDFTPLSPADPWLSTVQQKTYIKVDEQGTEAAAVTGAAMVESMPPQFRVERPFIFTVSDSKTGAILFLGRVTDPL